tara:strand:+ start:6395 stop:7333 length:939 start_codon:yes stop_codon:yes gene_type:complete
MILKNLSMNNNSKIKKYVFLGDTDSINIEIIIKSHQKLKEKLQYVVIGNILELKKYITKLKSNIKLNEILDPLDFREYNKHHINIFNIENRYKEKYKNLINQIIISNELSYKTKYDLVTMPINKYIFKEKIKFIGMTEYLGKLNKSETIMLMFGEKFSVIPLTTHINLKDIHKYLNEIAIKKKLNTLMGLLKSKKNSLNFKTIKFLCYNPHCSENSTIGNEDKIVRKIIKKFKKISGPYPADSAFKDYKKDTLFVSTYHDQVLTPYKIINKRGFNYTLGLSYRRLSPSHGTARDIKFKNKSDNTSYLACMLS